MKDAEQLAVERFAAAITFRTVADYPQPADPRVFTEFLDFVAQAFPVLFETADVKREDPWRLVLELAGSDNSLLPVLVLGHFDVVRVDEHTRSDWVHPPFSGTLADGFVWGRGSIDDKASVLAILEAADATLRSGRTPTRGLVIAFGGDEELAGLKGAARTASELRAGGRQFHFILDEGSATMEGVQSDVPMPLALVGLAEKGHVNVRISARTTGGHAAMPPSTTAVGIVGRAITRIESHPFQIRRIKSIESFFTGIGKVATGVTRFVYRHPRLFWPLLSRILKGKPSTNSLIRTTQAVTMAVGSNAANVLPQEAACVINVRILPGETVGSVLTHYRKLLDRIPVTVEVLDPEDSHDPIPETPASHPGLEAVAAAIAEVAPDVLTVPFIVTSSTDSKHYVGLSDAILRFVPMVLTMQDLDRVHGINERMAVGNYLQIIRFYKILFERVCWHE